MDNYTSFNRFGLLAGIIIFIIFYITGSPEDIPETAWSTSAIALMMAVFWITEALPISATALLPVIFLPLLGVSNVKTVTASYAHPLVFLFLGGFILAQSLQKWNLHKRIALNIIKFIGFNPQGIILGFMISAAFLSMWISNTATALMMLPIALSASQVIENTSGAEEKDINNFSIVLMLSIAYACSLGGVATLIGTPPNALMAAYMQENYNVNIGFAQWMLVGVPFSIIAIPIAYLLLTKLIYPVKLKLISQVDIISQELMKLGPASKQEKKVSIVFFLVALSWMIRPLLQDFIPGISDAGIAILGSVVLFIIPSGSKREKFLLGWGDVEKISWGILILFGGGLALASAIQESGLAKIIGDMLVSYSGIPDIIILAIITTTIIFLTELTSNLATTAAFLPITASIAQGMGLHPLEFAIPTALAASCAFMLPVATPPNAIVFSSGRLKISEMSKAGIILNITFMIIIIFLVKTLGKIVFNI